MVVLILIEMGRSDRRILQRFVATGIEDLLVISMGMDLGETLKVVYWEGKGSGESVWGRKVG